jgi:hypothetical protein
MFRMFAWACAAVGLLTATAGAQEKLSHKFVEGRKVVYQTEQKTEQTLTIAGMDIETKSTVFAKSSHTLGKREADGTIRQTEKNESMQVDMSLPGGLSFQFDSGNPDKAPDNAALEPLAKLLRLSFQMSSTSVFDRDNKLKTVEAPAELVAQVDPMFQSLFSAENLKKQVDTHLKFLPDDAVKPGDKWERNLEPEIGGGQTFFFLYEYQYTGIVEKDGRKLHRIVPKPLTVSYAMDPNAQSPLKVINSDLKIADAEGEILFDQERGTTHLRQGKTHIVGPMTFSVNGMELPGKVDLTISERVQLQPQ